MKKAVLTTAFTVGMFITTMAQQYITREGYIRFYSSTPVENIEAVTNQASSVIDAGSGEMVFQVLMRSFTFEKALMQEHFNENYVESEQFPKATFKGTVTNLSDVDFGKDGTYNATVAGTFTVHGVAREREITAKLTVKGSEVLLESVFQVAPADHDIEIPSAVRDNIAREVEVTVKAKYQLRS